MASYEEQYKKYSAAGQGQAINDLYDAQKSSQLTQLESAYQQSKAEAEAARDKLPGQYQQQANDLSAQYERNRRSFNQQAAASGLNTGTASQAALAQNSAYQQSMGKLRTAQADAVAEADRGLTNLERQYQTSVSAAIAENDYNRAKALYDEYNNGYTRDLNTAKTLAEFGDFSGYASLYGQETANNMSALWNAQNPGLAYNTGRITAEEYKSITGSYPPGYQQPKKYTPTEPTDLTDSTDPPIETRNELTSTEMNYILSQMNAYNNINEVNNLLLRLDASGALDKMSEGQRQAFRLAVRDAQYRAR